MEVSATRRLCILLVLLVLLSIFNGWSSRNDTATAQYEKQTNCQNELTSEEELLPNLPVEKDTTYKELLSNDRFLKSSQGIAFQALCYKVAKAYYSGDMEYITKISFDNPYAVDDTSDFSEIDTMIFRLLEYEEETKEAFADYMVQPNAGEAFEYLQIRMKQIEGEWKLISLGLDA